MKPLGTILCAALALAGCDLRYALLGWPQPEVRVDGPAPVELAYREAPGGLVVLTGRVNGKAEVDFVLDTGAPVTVLIDGRHTAGLGLDSSRARRLGPADNPAAPVGDIQEGFEVELGRVALAGLAAVVVPERTMPCRERFDAIGFGGVIGADLFRRFVVEIDPAARRIVLHEPERWSVPAGATSVPLAFRDGHPFVDATLAGADGRALPVRMHLDTGLNRPLTIVAGSHPALAMPADGAVRKSCYVNGVREEREGGALQVALGAARFEVRNAIYSEAANAVDGTRTSTIGMGLFAGRRIMIDYRARRLVIPSQRK